MIYLPAKKTNVGIYIYIKHGWYGLGALLQVNFFVSYTVTPKNHTKLEGAKGIRDYQIRLAKKQLIMEI